MEQTPRAADALERLREIARPIEERRDHTFNCRVRHADGTYRWMLSRGVAVRGKDGKPYRVAGSLTDIHRRRQAEEGASHHDLHDEPTGLPSRRVLIERLGWVRPF